MNEAAKHQLVTNILVSAWVGHTKELLALRSAWKFACHLLNAELVMTPEQRKLYEFHAEEVALARKGNELPEKANEAA